MAVTNLTINLTAAQWGAMSQDQQIAYLQSTGQLGTIQEIVANGNEVRVVPLDTAKQEGQQQKKPGVADQVGGTVGTIAGMEVGREGARQILGTGANAATTGTSAGTAATGAATGAGAGVTAAGVGSAAGTTLTIPAGAAVPAGYTAVGTAANGGTMVTSNAAASASSGLGTAALAGAGLSIVGGLYGAKMTADYTGGAPAGGTRDAMSAGQGAASGAAIGAGVGSIIPVVGTAVGAGVGALIGGAAGYAGSKFGSSKKKDQMKRDAIRKFLKEKQVVDDKYQITLSDGSKYDIGKDGNYKDAEGRRAWEMSTTPDEVQHQATGWAAPLATLVAGKDEKSASQLTGYFAKGAISNAGGNLETARKNLLAQLEKMGLTGESASKAIDELAASGTIDKTKADQLKYGIATLTSGKYFNNELERMKASQAGQGLPAGIDPLTGKPVAGSATTAPVGTVNKPQPTNVTGAKIDEIIAGNREAAAAAPATPVAPVAPVTSAPQVPSRSSTSSPGIGKDGIRISYEDEEKKKAAQNRSLLRL